MFWNRKILKRMEQKLDRLLRMLENGPFVDNAPSPIPSKMEISFAKDCQKDEASEEIFEGKKPIQIPSMCWECRFVGKKMGNS